MSLASASACLAVVLKHSNMEVRSEIADVGCRYPTPWYVPSEMWGSGIETKLKQRVLARTGGTDPDYLK